MKKLLLATVVGGLIVGGVTLAQNINIPQVTSIGPSDLFQDLVGGNPQAGNYYASAGQITSVASVAYSVPSTGFSITQGTDVTWTVINPAGTLATGTFTFNAAAIQGSRACIVSTQTQTAITFTGATGQTVTGAPSALVAGTPVCFVYIASVSTWFKA